LLKDVPGRHVVVTASAGIQVERELESVAIPAEDYDIQPILPEKFRDYLFTLYPDLEEEENRVSPTSLRTGKKQPASGSQEWRDRVIRRGASAEVRESRRRRATHPVPGR